MVRLWTAQSTNQSKGAHECAPCNCRSAEIVQISPSTRIAGCFPLQTWARAHIWYVGAISPSSTEYVNGVKPALDVAGCLSVQGVFQKLSPSRRSVSGALGPIGVCFSPFPCRIPPASHPPGAAGCRTPESTPDGIVRLRKTLEFSHVFQPVERLGPSCIQH